MKSWTARPLKFQLAALTVGLVVLALLVSGTIAVGLLRSYLVEQVDSQLLQVGRNPEVSQRGLTDGRLGPRLPSDLYVAFLSSDGAVERTLSSPIDTELLDEPDLPPLSSAAVAEQGRTPITVPSTSGDGDWRVLYRQQGNGSIAVARSLSEVETITQRLWVVMLVVGSVVVVMVGLLATWLVRRSLRPLRAVETTATEIAEGDLSQRVPPFPPTTEAGQVSRAMNTMLDQVESAFDSRSAALAEAQASEESMRRFVADASHELRTPLTSIKGFAELFRQGAITQGQVPLTFARIEGEADRMAGLVADLLVLARLEQEQSQEPHPVDLLASCLETVHLAKAAYPDRDLHVVPSSESGQAPIVMGDNTQLMQILRNLVTNALTYSEGPVVVRVDTGGQDAVVEVVDNGPGVPTESEARIFDRFYREDVSRTRDSGGSGLGLSIVRGLAEAHGGSVGVRANPDGGAIFWVRLPLAQVD